MSILKRHLLIITSLYHYKNLTFLQGYLKALENADEKVQLANQIYELVSMNVTLLIKPCNFFLEIHCHTPNLKKKGYVKNIFV